MKKWIDYCGGIRLCDVNVNDQSLIVGYSSNGVGVRVVPASDAVPDWMYDTAEEAVAAIRRRLEQEREVTLTIQGWLREQSAMIAKSIEVLDLRLQPGAIESRVIR